MDAANTEGASLLKTKAVPIIVALGTSRLTAGEGQMGSLEPKGSSAAGQNLIPCRMRIEVLPSTTGGGHKFKLSQVTVRNQLPAVR
jgi:hypothetical protein